jgi:pyruvate/2-oxoglutarate dehydrogenase complex dihydrolipoamide dehydrogenase (E3) component
VKHQISESIDLSRKIALVTGAARGIDRATCTSLAGKKETLGAGKVILTVGRKPEFSLLQLEKVGIRHEKGAILVNEHLETMCRGFTPRVMSLAVLCWRTWL